MKTSVESKIKSQKIKLKYLIDGNNFTVDVPAETDFFVGKSRCLARDFNDITETLDWYEKGFSTVELKPFIDVQKTKIKLSECIMRICEDEGIAVNKKSFKLEDYHKYVNENKHAVILKRTRDLIPEDFGFDIDRFLTSAKNYFKYDLGWEGSDQYNPKIIARINMPQSRHFNPAHKDIYQVYDKTNEIPQMVNIWIPICGVNDGVGLPLAPGSHLIEESKVSRTKAGSIVNGTRYSVNCIKDWDSLNQLTTVCPPESQMIVFSSFLIHGLARNLHRDTTRISLEFRLFRSR